jgi:hypothetical protein
MPFINRPHNAPFEKEAVNHVILVDGDKYVTESMGIFSPMLIEARIYHSGYAASCAIAQHKLALKGKTVEILPLRMSLVFPKGSKRG